MDELDLRLLAVMAEDPTESYAKIKDKLGVSIGTVYLRSQRLKEWGIIQGARLLLDAKKLGYSFSVAIRLYTPDVAAAIKVLEARSEVSGVYVLTGEQNLMVHAYLRSVNELNELIQFFQQSLKAERVEVQIILDEPIQRGVPVPSVEMSSLKAGTGKKSSSRGQKPSSKGKKK